MIQRSVFSFARAYPRELIRNNFNTSEIEHRALTYLPDEMIKNAPKSESPFSLFEGFKASLPEDDEEFGRGGKRKKHHSRHSSKGHKLLEGPEEDAKGHGHPKLSKLKREKEKLDHRLEMMGVRKTMCASEIREIDNKIANLNTMRKVVLDRLAGLEQEEHELELEIGDVAEKLEDLQEQLEDEAALAKESPALGAVKDKKSNEDVEEQPEVGSPGFMSESIYGKLPKAKDSPRGKRKSNRMPKRTISMPVLHEHMEPGTRIRELPAHNDLITALDFDAPFGTMVTAALDDTVRVWDLNAGRCMGLLEGHLSSVRCLQVEDNIVATGSMDASIRLWDLSQADYNPLQAASNNLSENPVNPEDSETEGASGEQLFTPTTSEPEQPIAQQAPEPSGDAMADCHLFTLEAHVDEVTALHFRDRTLVSGSADKTLRQWDLEKGRCVQTLDVLWAAAQAESINPGSFKNADSAANSAGSWWRPTTGRVASAEADFVGALQVFESALACGTADGMVRLWDLRSGMVHRSLVGHTGPVTALQFDDTFLVTGSRDRSIRVWDLRTGGIHDAYAYDHPVTSMMFDARRIVAAAGEPVVKVYDKVEGRQWEVGAGTMATAAQEEGEVAFKPSVVERVRIKDGYLVEGRRDGVVGVWSC
jgi:mitochondrial division protein 1